MRRFFTMTIAVMLLIIDGWTGHASANERTHPMPQPPGPPSMGQALQSPSAFTAGGVVARVGSPVSNVTSEQTPRLDEVRGPLNDALIQRRDAAFNLELAKGRSLLGNACTAQVLGITQSEPDLNGVDRRAIIFYTTAPCGNSGEPGADIIVYQLQLVRLNNQAWFAPAWGLALSRRN